MATARTYRRSARVAMCKVDHQRRRTPRSGKTRPCRAPPSDFAGPSPNRGRFSDFVRGPLLPVARRSHAGSLRLAATDEGAALGRPVPARSLVMVDTGGQIEPNHAVTGAMPTRLLFSGEI